MHFLKFINMCRKHYFTFLKGYCVTLQISCILGSNPVSDLVVTGQGPRDLLLVWKEPEIKQLDGVFNIEANRQGDLKAYVFTVRDTQVDGSPCVLRLILTDKDPGYKASRIFLHLISN